MKARVLDGISRGHMTFALILMGQFLMWDAVITHVFVGKGIVIEANLLVASAASSGAFILIKLLSLLALLPCLWVLHKFFPKVALSAATSVAMFYLGVVTWNFLVLFSNIA
jgi:hypothetical protein